MTPEEFQTRWRALSVPATASTLEASEAVDNTGVWIARDNLDRPHLLVSVPNGTQLDATGTHGLSVSIVRHRIPDRAEASYIDLLCLDPAVVDTFAAVAADIADETALTDVPDRRARVVAALGKWRWFWGVDPARLSSSDAVGLFGELWFLVRWAGVSPESIAAWEASNGARHDFQWSDRSVEVKATSRAGGAVHTIQHLEQLDDPETGDLYLFSLRIMHDALAANTLNSLVEAATSALTDRPEERAALLAKLGQRGYTPVGRDQSAAPYRVVDESLYKVGSGFPRLTRASFDGGLPNGVTSVSYQLDMAACEPWRAAMDPDTWASS